VRTLSALVIKALLQHDRDRDRNAMHELPRQYAAGKLAENPVHKRIVRDRHGAYYCATLQRRESDLKGAGQPAALAEIEADFENVRSAWEWAVSRLPRFSLTGRGI
jgi:hypothetical protein